MTTAPDLTDYRVIHDTLRTVPHRIAAALDGLDASDRARQRALARYWSGYAGEVLMHHTVEDDIFFPALVQRVPIAADHLARVEGDHHRLDELMADCDAAMARLATGADVAAEAAGVVRELAHHMEAHLDFEDEDLVPLFGRHFSAEEYESLQQQAAKHLGIGRQAAFTVPFVMHWAAPADGRVLLAAAPLPFRLLWLATRRRHARLVALALGDAGAPAEVVR